MVARCVKIYGFSGVGEVRQFLAIECADMDLTGQGKDKKVQVICKDSVNEITFSSRVQKGKTGVSVVAPPQFHRKESRRCS